jgi:Zn-dependent metalloprotease
MRIWSLVFITLLATAPVMAQPPALTPTVSPTVQSLGPTAKVTWNATRTAIARISGIAVTTNGATAGDRARNFVRAHAAMIGLEGDVAVEEVRDFTPFDPHIAHKVHTFVRLRPQWRGLPIDGRSLVVRLDADMRVTSVTSDLGPLDVPAPTRSMSATDAAAMVKASYRIVGINTPEKVVLVRGTAGRVAWKFAVAVVPLQAQFYVWVDVESGQVLKEVPAAFDQVMQQLPRREEVTP